MELLLPLVLIAIVGFLVWRKLQRGAHLTSGVIAAPQPVRAAAKRLEFRAQPNVHTINSLHSPELCVTAMACAYAMMDATQEIPDMVPAFQRHLGLTQDDARDMATLGPWVVAQGGGPTPAFERLTKRLKQLDHGTGFDKLMRVLGDATALGTKGMPSAAQADAMGALARIFRTA